MLSLLLISLCYFISTKSSVTDLRILAFQGKLDDASNRFFKGANISGYDYKTLEVIEYHSSVSDVSNYAKLISLKNYLDKYPSKNDAVILVLDSHSSIILAEPSEILHKFYKMNVDFLFIGNSVGGSISKNNVFSFNPFFSGMLAKSAFLHKVLLSSNPDVTDEYIHNLVNSLIVHQKELQVKVEVDINSQIFQLVSENSDDLSIDFEGEVSFLYNIKTKTRPLVAVTESSGKVIFNSLTNHLSGGWTPNGRCLICEDSVIDLGSLPASEYPIVQLTAFIVQPTPFLEVFFERLANLTYPKKRMHLLTICLVPEQRKYVQRYIKHYGSEYLSTQEVEETNISESSALAIAMSECWSREDCDFLFIAGGTAQFTNAGALEHLVAVNRSIVAPLMTRRGKYWSTFWGDISADGSYARSSNYFDIVERRQLVLWNVPVVGTTYLMSRFAVDRLTSHIIKTTYLPLGLCLPALQNNIFMYVDNRIHFGHLTNPETYNFQHLHNDLWQLFDNPLDWEERYIHADYHKYASKAMTVGEFEQPCQDVFWWPLASEIFCQHLIEELEKLDAWSDGSHSDPRLEGGYENVPTRDIHMRQISWEEHWLHVLRTYVYPLQVKLFEGYNDKPWARMNFVVRYKQGEQPSLRKHHDASSYTLDMALNRAHIDYQGGGVRFNRYNCSLFDTRVGWPLMFPGRITHLHEGLETTDGIRYIFVTFVNP